MKFWVNCPFGSREKVQNRFSTWLLGWPSWISNQNDFSYFCSGEEAKNRFSGWRPSRISDLKDFSYIWSTSPPGCFLPSFKSVGLSVQEKWKIDFQDGSHLRFPIGIILASFDQQVTQMLPTKFQINCPFCSGEAKIDFQDGGHLGFPIGTIYRSPWWGKSLTVTEKFYYFNQIF